jgi:prepilin-type N-terminal cleavage/methylation domain-containing protein
MRTRTAPKAFTLIELLVVIAIIGILSSVVLASMNSARKKGRDARRRQDLKSVQVALELHFDKWASYPVLGTIGTAGTGAVIATGSCTAASCTSLDSSAMANVPNDPLGAGTAGLNGGYKYAGGSTDYCLQGWMETATVDEDGCGITAGTFGLSVQIAASGSGARAAATTSGTSGATVTGLANTPIAVKVRP